MTIKGFIKVLTLYAVIKKLFQFAAQEEIKPLHKERLFILSLSLPLFLGIVFFGILFCTTGMERSFDFTSNGFQEFLTIYKFPLWIMLGSPALAALTAAMHRSRETNKQIELSQTQLRETQNKNNFDNYIRHLEYFEKRIGSFIQNELSLITCTHEDNTRLFQGNIISSPDFNSITCYRMFFDDSFFHDFKTTVTKETIRKLTELADCEEPQQLLERFGITFGFDRITYRTESGEIHDRKPVINDAMNEQFRNFIKTIINRVAVEFSKPIHTSL